MNQSHWSQRAIEQLKSYLNMRTLLSNYKKNLKRINLSHHTLKNIIDINFDICFSCLFDCFGSSFIDFYKKEEGENNKKQIKNIDQKIQHSSVGREHCIFSEISSFSIYLFAIFSLFSLRNALREFFTVPSGYDFKNLILRVCKAPEITVY